MLFDMTHRLRQNIREHFVHNLPHDATDQQLIEAESHISKQNLIYMVILDARAYTIKYVATWKKNNQAEKLDMQNRLNDAIRLLELDNAQDKDHTNELFDNDNTLKNTI